MSRRLRVLLLISDLGGGGAERQFSLLARFLSRQRFALDIGLWRHDQRYELPPDVPVHRLHKTRAWHVFRAIRDTRRLIDRLRPDLVFSQLHYVNMVTGTAVARARHRPRWICRQSNDPRREMQGPFARWARWALGHAEAVVCCSEGVRQATIEHLQVDPRRALTLDNLADVDAVRTRAQAEPPVIAPAGTFVVVHAGRLHAQKNQALLLDAFAALGDRPAELWLLGEGPLRASLEARAARLGIGSRIRWLGFRDNPFPLLRAADCFVLSSDYEGLPNAVIEAMLCGTPVIATRCPFGPDELIDDGVTGRLVPVGDTAAMATTLRAWADDPAQVAALGAAAQQAMATRFDPRTVVPTYEALFVDGC